MPTMTAHNELYRRFISVTNKVKLLSSLRKSVALHADYDIIESQWSAIESPLFAIEAKHLHKSELNVRHDLPDTYQGRHLCQNQKMKLALKIPEKTNHISQSDH